METKFINANQIHLAYFEKNAQSEQTIFFIHGNSSSSRTWKKQFSSELFNNYKLIAFDLPGCGQSTIENHPEWDYSPIVTGRIMAEAIKQLSAGKPYCLVGFSYGSNVVSEALNHKLAPKGISLLASCVIGNDIGFDKVFVPGDNIFFHDEVNIEDVSTFFSETLLSRDPEDIRIYTEDFFLAKAPFRSALIQSVVQGKLSDEIALIKKPDIPVQVFFGLEDKLLQINYLDGLPFNTWKNTVYKFPGAGHYLHNDQPESFNRLLAAYLEERFTTSHV